MEKSFPKALRSTRVHIRHFPLSPVFSDDDLNPARRYISGGSNSLTIDGVINFRTTTALHLDYLIGLGHTIYVDEGADQEHDLPPPETGVCGAELSLASRAI